MHTQPARLQTASKGQAAHNALRPLCITQTFELRILNSSSKTTMPCSSVATFSSLSDRVSILSQEVS